MIFLLLDIQHEMLWRVTLGLGAVPALIILIMRHDLPETAVWLVQKGRYREAKQVAREMFNDDLDMLPDQDVRGAEGQHHAPSSPISARTRSAGAPRSTAGSPASRKAASSRPSRSTCRCCS